jgi:predicted RNase H-like HicB family nuclease
VGKGNKGTETTNSWNGLRIIKVTVDKKDYHVKVTYDKSEVYCYTGQCVEFPNAISEGKTLEELKENMKEVIEMTLEPLPDEVVKRSA